MTELIDRQETLKKIETLRKAYLLHEPAGMGGISAIRLCKEIVEEQPTVEAEPVCEKILVELDHYYSTRKQICYPIGYPNILIYAVHCAVNGSYEEALDAIERVRKGRVTSGKELK